MCSASQRVLCFVAASLSLNEMGVEREKADSAQEPNALSHMTARGTNGAQTLAISRVLRVSGAGGVSFVTAERVRTSYREGAGVRGRRQRRAGLPIFIFWQYQKSQQERIKNLSL